MLLPLLMGGSAYAQCVIKADLKDVTGETAIVQIWKPDFTGIEKTDTLKVKKGKFTIQNNDSKMRLATCMVKTEEGEKRMSIYMVPGENATITGTTEKNIWNGSQFYKDYQELENATDPIQRRCMKWAIPITAKWRKVPIKIHCRRLLILSMMV